MLDRVRSAEPANPGLGFLVFLVVLACRDLAKTAWLQLHMADYLTTDDRHAFRQKFQILAVGSLPAHTLA